MLIEGGKHWSFTMRAGWQLKLTDLEGGTNVGMLFYNPQNTWERYNAPDTLKCQHTFKLTQGHCLYSDMGRIFASVTQDSVGWHDTVCGTSSAQSVQERFGVQRYQEHRNDWYQNGLDAFLVEGGKYGLGRRDLAANVNWFSRVTVGGEGSLAFSTAAAPPGSAVALRFEMDTLVLLHTCPHPLDPCAAFPRHPVRLQLRRAAPVTDDDPCLNACPENRRGFQNNRLYHLAG
jgi:urea carboxylase-associated protein 2